MGYAHATITLILIGISAYYVVVPHFRFSFRLKHQKIWIAALIISNLMCLASSIIHYQTVWQNLNAHLQMMTLPTIFSGIAAVFVVVQVSNSPLVFTTVDPRITSEIVGLVLPVDIESKIKLFIHNCSKITANDVAVIGNFPEQITVRQIHSPTWTSITNDGHRFEVHLDSDRSYNPIHPFGSPSFEITVIAKSLPGPTAIVIHTMSRNTERRPHTFFIATCQDDMHDLKKKVKGSKLPFVKVRENYYNVQRFLVVILVLLAAIPWVVDLAHHWIV